MNNPHTFILEDQPLQEMKLTQRWFRAYKGIRMTSFPPEFIYEIVRRWECTLCVTSRFCTLNKYAPDVGREIIKAEEEKNLVRIEFMCDIHEYYKMEGSLLYNPYHMVFKEEWDVLKDEPFPYLVC